MSFQCDRCGECCRHIGVFPFMRKYDRGDGVCVHLTGDNLCDIYDERPDFCDTYKLYERIYSGSMSLEEYERMNEVACQAMKAKGNSLAP